MCDDFKVNILPGLCIYKFLYVWMDLVIPGQPKISKLAWLYWLPNPLFPFIWYRVGLPAAHPELSVRRYSSDGNPHKA